jgi:DNA-binding transcriptional MerR regulator
MGQFIPGTVIPGRNQSDGIANGVFSLLLPMIKAADGLTLAQVCSITALEPSTIQNWVKRGYVARPVKKKYFERHLARILIISMLRDSMKIEDIGLLMKMINGDATSEEDDIIYETDLYDCLCEVIGITENVYDQKEQEDHIRKTVRRYKLKNGGTEQRLCDAVRVMLSGYRTGVLKRECDMHLACMKERYNR